MNRSKKTISFKFKRYNSLGSQEVNAAKKVIMSGQLSPFLGAWELDKSIGNFYGGKKIREFENVIKKHFNVKHAIAVNSWT
jgi:perosamine synthetase